MARFLVRRDSIPDYWMIWDREKRGPAEVFGRALVRLTLAEAELAMVGLTGEIKKSAEPSIYLTLEVTYRAGAKVPCAREVDARLLARELVKRGHKVSAKTLEGILPSRFIEPHQVHAWLNE
jgi:hypothetical protein